MTWFSVTQVLHLDMKFLADVIVVLKMGLCSSAEFLLLYVSFHKICHSIFNEICTCFCAFSLGFMFTEGSDFLAALAY